MRITLTTIGAIALAAAAPAIAGTPGKAPAASQGATLSEVSKFHPGRRHRHGYNGRIWRDDRGRYRCRRDDGTVGLIVGGGVGALVGREIDGGRDRTVGTVVGAAAGALIGREIDRSDARCE